MKIHTPNGRSYELTETAIFRLMDAKNGRDADIVFEGFASHVPNRDRCAVWFAVDNV